MIFNNDPSIFESEKERNLYYKFFAGYFLNELVCGYEERVKNFYRLLFQPENDDQGYCFGDFYLPNSKQKPPELSVTFDFHGYLLDSETDRGELADILIQDSSNNVFIAIEAKYLEDWSYEKDICNNADRIQKLTSTSKSLYQVLLVTENKLDNVRKKENNEGSNWKKLLSEKDRLKIPLRIITWEQLLGCCDKFLNDPAQIRVINFFRSHLLKKQEDYRLPQK